MPVSVHIPSRIVVDPQSLRERPVCVEEALAGAFGRAIEHSRREVVAPRGGYVGVRLNAPQFRWSGEAVGEATPEQRAELEARIRAAILQQVDDIGLVPRRRPHGSMPLTDAAFERLDPARYNEALGLYEVPVYDNGGKKKPAKLTSKKGAKPPVEYVEKGVWQRAPKNLLYSREYGPLLREMLSVWQVPPTGKRGMIWREPDRWWLSVHEEGRFYDAVHWTHFTMRTVAKVDGRLAFKPVNAAPSVGLATARVITAAQARESMKNDFRRAIVEHQQQKGPIGFEFAQQLEQKVEEELAKAFRLTDMGALIVEIEAVDAALWLHVPTLNPWEGVAILAPLTKLVKVKAEVPSDEERKEPEDETIDFGQDATTPGSQAGGLGKGKKGAAEAGEERKGKGGKGKPGVDPAKEGKSPGALKGYGKAGGVPDQAELAKAFGFIYTGADAATATAGALFPSGAVGAVAQCTDPFNGEPSWKELGSDGELLRELIEEIAFKLQMQPCEYAGRFAMAASQVQAGRAVAVSEYAMDDSHVGFVQPVEPKPGSVGTFDFVPSVSPAIQFMRHLAGVTPRISRLVELLDVVYTKPGVRERLAGDRYRSHIGWFIDFGGTINGFQKRAVGAIFAMTCRVVLMQLLRSSQKGIEDRLANLDAYSAIFEELIKLQLADVAELSTLRDELRREVFDITKIGSEITEEFMDTWQSARKGLIAALEFRSPFAHIPIAPSQRIVTAPDGTKAIKDSKGNLWTLSQLDRAIALNRDTINQIDPLIPQITLDREVLERFTRNPQNTRAELARLLREMKGHNDSKIAENRSDRKFGFRAGSINRNIRGATIPGTYYQLTGVHLMTHELIGEFFAGSIWYILGVNSLLKAQEGWEDFKLIAEFVGVTFLAVFCAPLAFVVGGALAIYHYHEAQEKKSLFQALLDPELVITRAEVEAELFAAELGLLLSFIPDAGPILRGGMQLGKGVIKGEAKAAARLLGRRLARRITVDMVKALKGNLAESFAKALVSAQVMNMVLGKLLIEPAMQQLQRDLASYEQIVAMANRQ